MKPAFSLYIGSVGLSRRIKSPNMHRLTMHKNRRAKSRLSGINPEKSGLVIGVCLNLILLVCEARQITEIVKSVVALIVVSMVNVILRPFAGHVEPCCLMGVDPYPPAVSADGGLYVAARITMPEWLSTLRAGYPSDSASFRVVMNKFTKLFCGKIGFSHETGLSLIGQRPGTMGSRYPASSF